MGKKTPRKKIAAIKAHREMGLSIPQVAAQVGVSTFTVNKYLADQEAYNDPRINEMVSRIKEQEIADLYILNLKAKQRLHERAAFMNPIESIALMDRTFQQIRLAEGKSTANIATMTKFVEEANKINEAEFQAAHVINPKDSDLETAT